MAAARAGFFAFGERGKTSERVADEAVEAILAHDCSGAAVDPHLADQLVLPCTLAGGVSAFTTARLSAHLTTNLWVVEQFGIAASTAARTDEGTVLVEIAPRACEAD